MARKKPREQTIFFPWERSAGLLRGRGARAKPIAAGVVMVAFLLLLGARERRLVGIRSTRATLAMIHAGVSAYRADHERRCPPSLTALKSEGYIGVEPIDAWGSPIRLICPGKTDPNGYDLMSDGPDRQMGGLDRVE